MSIAAKHIVFLCSRLDLPGGIERAIVNTANLFIENGQQVTLVVLDKTAATFYPLHESVRVIQKPLSFGITQDGNVISRKITLLTDVLKLRSILRNLKADTIIGTEYPFTIAAFLSRAKGNAALISWEHHHFYELGKSSFWERLFRRIYPRLQAVICLNEDEKKLFQSLNKNVIVIPNFIDVTINTTGQHQPTILTVARLTDVKGTDRLLEVAKKVLRRHLSWTWKLIGDGEYREQVEKFIADNGLKEQLLLQRPIDHNILPAYQQASIYVMTSRNECFPMVLLEAQSAGLPCIAFDCETGPRHIIIDQENGLLIEDENIEAMSLAVSSLIDDENKRNEMSNQASVNVERFSSKKVYGLWEAAIS